MALVKDELKDPDSARVRDLFANQIGIVCGQVNAKNSYGGYTGFRYFVADLGIQKALIVPDIDRLASGRGTATTVAQAEYDHDALKEVSKIL